MANAEPFTIRLPAKERELLDQLATREERTRADTVRMLIRRAAQDERAPASKQGSAPITARTLP